MNAAALPAGGGTPTAADRLLATAVYALAVHAVVLLGLRVHLPDPPAAAPAPPLEIVLLRQPPVREVESPPRPDYLAQHSHAGSGQVARPEPPETRAPGVQAPPAPVLGPPAPPSPPPAPVAAPRPELRAPTARRAAPAPRPPAPAPAPPAAPSAAQVLAGVRDYAALSARTGQRDLAPGTHKREKYVDASTREHAYAAYLEAWRQKVEAIGNLNYPAAARAQHLAGTLRLSVRIGPDGQILSIELRRSSGHRVLDDAAADIVNLAAPFAPFTDAMRQQTDVLVITRTWQFRDDTLRGQ